MSRSPRQNREIRDARREELIDAATRVFAEKGYGQARISDIAAAAGLSHGLLYHYFDSKEAIFEAIVTANTAEIDADFAVEGAAIEKIAHVIARMQARGAEPLGAMRVISQALFQGQVRDKDAERMRDDLVSLHGKIVAWISEAQADGDLDSSLPPEEFAGALACFMRGMAIRAPNTQALPFRPPSPTTILHLLKGSAGESRAMKRPSGIRPRTRCRRSRLTRPVRNALR